MKTSADSMWHFYVMMLVSVLIFLAVLRIILSKSQFAKKARKIAWLSFIVVVVGMFFGKFGVRWGLPWWIYYTVPALATILLPPIVLKLNTKNTIAYLLLSFCSAPIIHAAFSFFLGWSEYMPFWNIPYWKSIF